MKREKELRDEQWHQVVEAKRIRCRMCNCVTPREEYSVYVRTGMCGMRSWCVRMAEKDD